MGSFDCYCAFCAGPLTYINRIGSRSKRALARRRRHIALEKRRRASERINLDTDDEEVNSDDAVDRDGFASYDEALTANAAGDADHDSGFDSDYEESSYDPELVTEDPLKWTGICRCLGFNGNAHGNSK